MRVNLVADQKKTFSINWTEIFFIILFIIIFFFLGINYYLSSTYLGSLKTEIRNLDQQLVTILPKQQEYIKLQKGIKALDSKEKEIKVYYQPAEVVKEMAYLVPESMMLKYLTINKSTLTLGGIAADSKNLVEFIRNMKNSPFFTEVRLNQMNQKDELNFKIEAVIALRGD